MDQVMRKLPIGIQTFEAYFRGQKDLFKGLAIEGMETEWNEYPVLHLDLNAEKYDSPDRLYQILDSHLNIWEDKYGKNVVVLVDEYGAEERNINRWLCV